MKRCNQLNEKHLIKIEGHPPNPPYGGLKKNSWILKVPHMGDLGGRQQNGDLGG